MLQNNNFNYFIRYEIIAYARAFANGFDRKGESHGRGVYMQYFNLNFWMFEMRARVVEDEGEAERERENQKKSPKITHSHSNEEQESFEQLK